MDDNIFISKEDIQEEIDIDENECKISDDDDNDKDDDKDDKIDESQDNELENAETRDDSILTFCSHKDAVLCCSISKNGLLAVSGDQNDLAYVWDLSNGDIKFECKGHKDSVICVGFSQKDNYVATGDMSGLVQIWTNNGDKITEYEVDEINWLHWHPLVNNVLLAGTKEGTAWMWQINDKDNSNCKTYQSFGFSNTAGIFLNDGKKSAMGYDDGSLRIWDLKNNTVVHNITGFFAHHSTITSIDCTNDDSLIGTGSVDHTAKIINTQSGKVLATFQCGTNFSNKNNDEDGDDNNDDSVESVSFCSHFPLFATGTVNGAIEIWDISYHSRRHLCTQNSGISKLLWHPTNYHLLLTGGLDGVLRIYDGRSGQLYSMNYGHLDQILDFCVLNDKVLTSSEDKMCKVFSLNN